MIDRFGMRFALLKHANSPSGLFCRVIPKWLTGLPLLSRSPRHRSFALGLRPEVSGISLRETHCALSREWLSSGCEPPYAASLGEQSSIFANDFQKGALAWSLGPFYL
jgi:hypothetical protein